MAGGIDKYTKLLLHGDGTDTATFVPDSSNIKEYSGTVSTCVLMLHFDGADEAVATKDAATDKTVTFVNNAQIDTAQSKFGGSSLLLDGTADYLTLADSADFDLSNGNFTIKFAIKFNAIKATNCVFSQKKSDATGISYGFVYSNSSGLNFYYSTDGTTVATVGAFAWTALVDTWYQIEIVRYGNTIQLFVDGVSKGAETHNVTFNNSAELFYIGRDPEQASYDFNGWIDDFAIYKGIALHTADFTPDTVSPSPKDVVCNGNAQIDTAQKEFGTGSILFDGTGDYLSLVDSDDWNFGSGDFTIDCWFNVSDVSIAQPIFSKADSTTKFFGCWWVQASSTFVFRQWNGTGYDFSVSSATILPTINNWYHLALVRSGNNFKFFINGVGNNSDFTGMTVADLSSTLYIGYWCDTGDCYKGWIDELRISKGIARWTSDFTSPTSAYDATIAKPRAILITE